MKALKSNLLEVQIESQGSDPVDQVFQAIDSMSDDERILLYENGIEFILWLRDKNPSLLATLAADVRARHLKIADPG